MKRIYSFIVMCFTIMILVVGIDKFKDSINALKIGELKKKLKALDNSGIIFIDNGFNLKKMAFEGWYNELVINTNGIWIGRGVSEQSVIKMGEFNKKYSAKITNDFAWYFKNGEGTLIKLINGDEKNEEQSVN